MSVIEIAKPRFLPCGKDASNGQSCYSECPNLIGKMVPVKGMEGEFPAIEVCYDRHKFGKFLNREKVVSKYPVGRRL